MPDKVSFDIARVVDYWTEFPLDRYGNTSDRIYYMRIRVNTDSYSTISTSATLGSAASAGVYALPPGFTGGAKFCGDRSIASLSGGICEFVRVFADVPSPYTDYSVGIRNVPPVYGYNIEPTRYGLDDTPQANVIILKTRKRGYVINPADSFPVRMRLDVTFSSATPSTPIEEEGYTLTRSDGEVTKTTFAGQSDVEQTSEGVVTVTVTGTTKVIQGTQSVRWMGDIYKNVTGYRD
mgnify:CR=1 FL=1